jgi:hypothetical protein
MSTDHLPRAAMEYGPKQKDNEAGVGLGKSGKTNSVLYLRTWNKPCEKEDEEEGEEKNLPIYFTILPCILLPGLPRRSSCVPSPS